MNNIVKAINELIEISRFYDHDSEYKKHVKRLKKLKKKLKKKGGMSHE